MTEDDLRHARRALRERGQVRDDVLAQLHTAVEALCRFGGLPPSLAPYGVWDDDAVQEVFQGWLAERLLREGALQSLLDRARTAGALRRMAERSARQWLLNQRTRSQSQNVYTRISELLRDDDRFACVRAASTSARSWWALRGHEDLPEWADGDDALLSAAWSLGDFAVVRYRASAKKLAPVLSTEDLARFVEGLLCVTARRLTLELIAAAMQRRFGLDPIAVEALDTVPEPPEPAMGLEDAVALGSAVAAIVQELTARQAAILLATRAEATWEKMAAEHGCSPATISNEQRRIAQVVRAHAADDRERDVLLRMTGDALYEGSTSP